MIASITSAVVTLAAFVVILPAIKSSGNPNMIAGKF